MEWISIKDQLPTETDKYQVKTDDGKVRTVWYVIAGTFGSVSKDWGYEADKFKNRITHWREIQNN